MSTIKNVAERAGVSVEIVSKVLAEDDAVADTLRQQVREAMHALDFDPDTDTEPAKS